MNFDELVIAFIEKFCNPLIQNVVSNAIGNLKPDLGESKYSIAIFNMNTKFDELAEKLVDQPSSFIKSMYK